MSKWKTPIIAIDIAYRKPVALVGLSATGRIGLMRDMAPSQDIYHTVNDVLDVLIPFGAKTLVLSETPLIINNMNSAFMLTRFHAMLEKGVRDAGQMFFGIHPLTWQSEILAPKKGDDRKKLSIAVATEYCRHLGWDVDLSDDTADALNIARYGLVHRKDIMEAIKGGRHFSEKRK